MMSTESPTASRSASIMRSAYLYAAMEFSDSVGGVISTFTAL
jgi:hypothetical protein